MTDNEQRLRGLIDLCNRERFDGLDELANALEESMTFDNPITGPTDKTGMRNFHSTLWRAFPDFNYETSRTMSEGNTVLLECTFKGTHKDDLMGMPPTNKEIALPIAFVVDFSGGKVQKWKTYFDTGTLMRQLGKAP